MILRGKRNAKLNMNLQKRSTKSNYFEELMHHRENLGTATQNEIIDLALNGGIDIKKVTDSLVKLNRNWNLTGPMIIRIRNELHILEEICYF